MNTGGRSSVREDGESTYNWQCSRPRSHPVQQMAGPGVCAICLTERLSHTLPSARRESDRPLEMDDGASCAGARLTGGRAPCATAAQEMSTRHSAIAGSVQSIASLVKQDIDEALTRQVCSDVSGFLLVGDSEQEQLHELAVDSSHDKHAPPSLPCGSKQQLQVSCKSRSYSTSSRFNPILHSSCTSESCTSISSLPLINGGAPPIKPGSCRIADSSTTKPSDFRQCKTTSVAATPGSEELRVSHPLLPKSKSTGSNCDQGQNRAQLRSPTPVWNFWHKKQTRNESSYSDDQYSSPLVHPDHSVPFMKLRRSPCSKTANCIQRDKLVMSLMGAKWSYTSPSSFPLSTLLRRTTSGRGPSSSASSTIAMVQERRSSASSAGLAIHTRENNIDMTASRSSSCAADRLPVMMDALTAKGVPGVGRWRLSNLNLWQVKDARGCR